MIQTLMNVARNVRAQYVLETCHQQRYTLISSCRSISLTRNNTRLDKKRSLHKFIHPTKYSLPLWDHCNGCSFCAFLRDFSALKPRPGIWPSKKKKKKKSVEIGQSPSRHRLNGNWEEKSKDKGKCPRPPQTPISDHCHCHQRC